MTYNYSTPENAILSLELAYTNKDLEAVLNSKDFIAEAKIILENASYEYGLSDNELISETAELLKLTLIRSLQENGFPDFIDAQVEFSGLSFYKDNLHHIEEIITYPDGTCYNNKIFLIFDGFEWKVATIEE